MELKETITAADAQWLANAFMKYMLDWDNKVTVERLLYVQERVGVVMVSPEVLESKL